MPHGVSLVRMGTLCANGDAVCECVRMGTLVKK